MYIMDSYGIKPTHYKCNSCGLWATLECAENMEICPNCGGKIIVLPISKNELEYIFKNDGGYEFIIHEDSHRNTKTDYTGKRAKILRFDDWMDYFESAVVITIELEGGRIISQWYYSDDEWDDNIDSSIKELTDKGIPITQCKAEVK